MEYNTPGFTSGAKRTHWQAAVAQQELSGLSAAAFCREQGLSYQSFISWRKRFATEGRGDVEHDRQGGRTASESRAISFREVRVSQVGEDKIDKTDSQALGQNDQERGAWLEVVIGPATVRVPPAFDERDLCRLLAALASVTPAVSTC
ncbi:MAG: hypothetical protein RLY93_03175 [Sumerlaeia bacterium]